MTDTDKLAALLQEDLTQRLYDLGCHWPNVGGMNGAQYLADSLLRWLTERGVGVREPKPVKFKCPSCGVETLDLMAAVVNSLNPIEPSEAAIELEQTRRLEAEEELNQLRDKLAGEKQTRIKYQDIVYRVCNLVDKARGDHRSDRCTIKDVVERMAGLLTPTERGDKLPCPSCATPSRPWMCRTYVCPSCHHEWNPEFTQETGEPT